MSQRLLWCRYTVEYYSASKKKKMSYPERDKLYKCYKRDKSYITTFSMTSFIQSSELDRSSPDDGSQDRAARGREGLREGGECQSGCSSLAPIQVLTGGFICKNSSRSALIEALVSFIVLTFIQISFFFKSIKSF